ncbi:MAG: M15 family metallopeptidase [Clostridia bacterium]|nr:M15 family metallopeptidase [Clostridia bacterium]
MDLIKKLNGILAILLVLASAAAVGCAPAKQAAKLSAPEFDPAAFEPSILSAAPTASGNGRLAIAAFGNDPEPTAATVPDPTEEPTPEPTEEPTPTPEGYLTDEERLMLVNMENTLDDDYVPHDLVRAVTYLGNVCKHRYYNTMIQIEVADQLKKMFEAAKKEGVRAKYLLVSAYRTQEMQGNMWRRRIASNPHYGDDPYNKPVGTMPYNASEHCAGLAVDVTSESFEAATILYGRTKEAAWMRENAHRFGFILRYQKEKEHLTGVHYEPWHFRYVGVEAATEIYEAGLCLEEYLGRFPSYMLDNIDDVLPDDDIPTAICLPAKKYGEDPVL